MKKLLKTLLLIITGLLALAILFFTVRHVQTRIQLEREGQFVPAAIPNLKTTTRLEITPLYEESGDDQTLISGHGVSYLIRTDSTTLILDLGNNPVDSTLSPFISNMQTLGVTWREIDAILISHPHPDHVGGTRAWKEHTFSLGDFSGDMTQLPIYTPIPMIYPGAKVILSSEPILISSDVATTGVISYPEVFPLSLLDPRGTEQALVVNVEGEGLVLITGCSHPGVEKLVLRAEQVYGMPVAGVFGGLHYQTANTESLQPHIAFLESRHPRLVALSPHDSSPEVILAFQSAFPEASQTIQVGTTTHFP